MFSVTEREKNHIYSNDSVILYVSTFNLKKVNWVRIWFPWCLLFMSNKLVTFEAFGFILLGTSLKFWTTAIEASDFD